MFTRVAGRRHLVQFLKKSNQVFLNEITQLPNFQPDIWDNIPRYPSWRQGSTAALKNPFRELDVWQLLQWKFLLVSDFLAVKYIYTQIDHKAHKILVHEYFASVSIFVFICTNTCRTSQFCVYTSSLFTQHQAFYSFYPGWRGSWSKEYKTWK